MKTKLIERYSHFLRLDRGLSERTVQAYSTDLRQFLRTGDAAKATRAEVRRHLARLKGQGVNARSIARKLSALRLFYKMARADGICRDDPTRDVDAPSPGRRLPRTLTGTQVEALLEAPLRENRATDALMLRTLYAAGLRVSELIALSAADVDSESGVLRVRGKGEKTRLVPVDSETARLLAEHARKPPGGQSCPTLFFSSRGGPFTRQGFWKLVRKYAKAAGIEGQVSPHVLRHAFATHLLERGMNLRSLQMVLGHSDISTTQIYSHVSTTHLRATLAKYHPRGGKA